MTLRDKEAEKYAFIGIGVNNKGEEYKDYDIRKMKGFKAGFDLAVKTVKAECEKRMTRDYNSGNEEIDSVAQGVCAGILVFLDTLINN